MPRRKPPVPSNRTPLDDIPIDGANGRMMYSQTTAPGAPGSPEAIEAARNRQRSR